MRKRLFKGDHPDVANSLNNLAVLLQAQGKLADAEPLLRDALDMTQAAVQGRPPRRGPQPEQPGGPVQGQGKLADAEPLLQDALAMQRRLTAEFASQYAEGER